MKYLTDAIRVYLNDLAGNKPAPGGGSAAALTGCIGVSLLLMAAEFTLGKKEYKKSQPAVSRIKKRLYANKRMLESLIDKDARVYNKVDAVLKLPKSKKRIGLLEGALKKAAGVPMEICRVSRDSLNEAPTLFKICNKHLISDVECGTLFLKAAYMAAKINADVNLKYIRDRKFARSVKKGLKKWQSCLRVKLPQTA